MMSRHVFIGLIAICLCSGHAARAAYAQATSQSINAQLIETTYTVDNCQVLGGVVKCHYFMEYHLFWDKDASFPAAPPSATGYWSSFVWKVSDSWNPVPTIIATANVYSGVSHAISHEGMWTPGEAAALRASTLNDNWRAFSHFTTSTGTQITLESNPGIVYLAMAFDPTDAELEVRPENNAHCSADPVYLHSGQFYYQCAEMQIPGRQLDVSLAHTYYSGMSFNGPFGYGWMLNYYMRLNPLENGNVVIVSGDGRKTQYTLSGTVYLPPPGRFEILSKNPDNTWALAASDGGRHEFDAEGKLVAVKDRNDNTITLAYDTGKQPVYGYSEFAQDPLAKVQIGLDYRLIRITDTTGRLIDFTYNADGLLDKIIDGSREVVFNYDPATNDLLSVTKPATAQFPSGVTKSFEYEDHNVKRVKDAKNQYFVENFFDAEGRVQEQNLGGHSFTFDYSVVDQVTETDRKGFENVYTFNAAGNMVQKEEKTNGLRLSDPASFVTTYAYNADSLKTAETFPKGNGVKYTYDSANPDPRSRGNLLQVRRKTVMTAADNNTNDLVTVMTYEPLFNQINTVIDPKGNTTAYTYDHELNTGHPKYGTKSNLIFIDQPAVAAGTPTTEFSYNSFGQVTESIDPNGNATQYAYDPVTGYLTDIRQDPAGINAHTHFTYDSFGNLDVVTDANNHTTDYDYDALGWLNKVTNPLGFINKHTYDANGNIIKTQRQADALATAWQATEFTYDILNKLKTVKDPLNRVTAYNYDNNENLASVVDAENNTTGYVYDERDLLFTVTDANTPAGVTTYDYDLNGNLAKITDANNNPTTYTYDLFDRLDITQYANSSSSNFDYDKNSNLTRHTTPGGKPIDYVYDALNRLTAKNFPLTPALNTTYAYDLDGRMIDANNTASQIHHAYDTLNRVTTTTQHLSPNTYNLSYQYDKAGNRTQLTYPSGKTVDYDYDANDRLTSITHNTLNFLQYQYDPLDRRTTKSYLSTSLPLTSYQYDIANQLTSITNTLVNGTPVSQYAYPLYDQVGNRKQLDRTLGTNPAETTNYAYNDIYELTGTTGDQTHSYDYDSVANREVADSTIYTPNNLNQYTNVGGTSYLYDNNGNLTSDGSKTYTYDEQNRLLSMVNGLSSASYTYDALNRRVAKTVAGATTYFIYDGDEVIADYDGTGALNAEYINGDTIDEVLAMERGGNTYYYHQDGLGSVTELTDATGALAENYTYDPYGNPSVINSTISNRYRFTGREFDEENGIYHYRARAYDSLVGRFLQRDPIGYYDSMNLFAYVKNNPINFIDPYGLYEVGFKGLGNPIAEKLISDAISKNAPEMPKHLADKAAKTLRKEMTADEYKKLNDSRISDAEKAKVSQEIIKRAQEKPENQELKQELQPYLDKLFPSEPCPANGK